MNRANNISPGDIFLPEPATLAQKRAFTAMETFFEFKLDSGKSLGHKPGQFVEVSLAGIGEAPISVSSAPTANSSFELVVRRVGNLTNALHGLPVGGKVGIRGPFGTSFPVDGAMQGKELLFICGGIGLVPVRSAILHVLNNRASYGSVTILFGAKTPSDRLFVDEIPEWQKCENVKFYETVDYADDKWKGNVGVVTKLIPPLKLDWAKTVAVICGPPVMYKFVIIELNKVGLKNDAIYLSLERLMKCGVGKCGHCQVNHLYMCQDGPVVRYADISKVPEAI
jgi:NAD(P)H-flavin reductase